MLQEEMLEHIDGTGGGYSYYGSKGGDGSVTIGVIEQGTFVEKVSE